ncbi:hypothetical protein [Mucilaginibacter xinganensis]|uniref:Outer membrane protein beta-barrel domain-containing protein n=1 Tax=Mucilaginibacter xinganensis TaxID=1234841 RepID=A0A223NZ70_9SPHI|nr:hypothetical protein [Mucilaginibacter xinganensis]ASU35163.1 hypothetical protein MuYL_3278 [Mucilaginibacter xinganensis]
MSTDNEKRLDDLFKKKLEDPVDEIRYEEEDWDALEQMLDKPKRKGIIWLLPMLGAVAAMLLLFLGWWAFRPKTNTQPNKDQMHAAIKQAGGDTAAGKSSARGLKNTDGVLQRQANVQPKPADTLSTHKLVQQSVTPGQKKLANAAYATKVKTNKTMPGLPSRGLSGDTAFNEKINRYKAGGGVNDELIATNSAAIFSLPSTAAQPVRQIDLPRPAYVAPAGVSAIKSSKKGGFRPQYALSVVAAPDINGVGSFQQSKLGTNIGLMFAATVSKKFTISTGALYSVKPYLTNFNNYNTGSAYKFPANPVNVTADCRMLDIPLNVNYQLYHKQQNKFSLGTGLSSYIMLHESYKFNYNYGASGPSGYNVANPGKYFFGVVNLNATYERQLNSKVGISVQPYLKLPLSNVGYSQVKLQTTGVAVGLSWNLNSLTKP